MNTTDKYLAEGLLFPVGQPRAKYNDTVIVGFDAVTNQWQQDVDIYLPYRDKIEKYGCKAISIFTAVELTQALDPLSGNVKFLPPVDPLKDAILYIRNKSNVVIAEIPLRDLYHGGNHKLYFCEFDNIDTRNSSVRFLANNNAWQNNDSMLYFKFWYNKS